MKIIRNIIFFAVLIAMGLWLARHLWDEYALKQIIARLQADSRVAEVLVTGVNYNEQLKHNVTTIKFLEYDTQGRPLHPRYFTFPGNIIQFQSLVVRFEDKFVAAGDRLRGRSVYLFWKAFMLDGANTREFPITYVQEIPDGYKVGDKGSAFEQQFWQQFWSYAFDQHKANHAGIKSVQIEAQAPCLCQGICTPLKLSTMGA